MNFFGQCFKLRFPIELMLNWMATQNMTALYLKGDRERFTNLLTVLVRYAQAWAYGIHFAAFVLPVENLSLDMVIRLERFTIENRWQWFDISFLKCKIVRILIFPRHLKPWLFFVVQEIRYIQWEMKWNDHGIRRKSIGSPCSRFPPFFLSAYHNRTSWQKFSTCLLPVSFFPAKRSAKWVSLWERNFSLDLF